MTVLASKERKSDHFHVGSRKHFFLLLVALRKKKAVTALAVCSYLLILRVDSNYCIQLETHFIQTVMKFNRLQRVFNVSKCFIED